MKVVFLSKEYPPFGLNFASALFFPGIARAFAKQGHQVHVISQTVDKGGDYEDDGIIVHRVGPKPKSGSAMVRMLYNLSAWLKLVELIMKGEAEIVDAPITFAEGFLSALFKGKPLILYTFAFSEMFIRTSSFAGAGELLFLELSSLLEKISLHRADRVIANSPDTRDFLLNYHVPKERIREIWEVRIDFDKWAFTQSDIRSKLGIPSEVPMVLYVGWLQARKGVHVLCRSIKRILQESPDATFVFVGRDTPSALGGTSFKRFILETARENGFLDKVRIIEDFLSEEELIKLYSACDTFVLPSVSETFGWPVIEALSCGKKVVATRTGISPALKRLGIHGLWVVTPGKVDELALAIVKSLRAQTAPESHAYNMRILRERFDFERMLAKVLAAHVEVLNGGQRAGDALRIPFEQFDHFPDGSRHSSLLLRILRSSRFRLLGRLRVPSQRG